MRFPPPFWYVQSIAGGGAPPRGIVVLGATAGEGTAGRHQGRPSPPLAAPNQRQAEPRVYRAIHAPHDLTHRGGGRLLPSSWAPAI